MVVREDLEKLSINNIKICRYVFKLLNEDKAVEFCDELIQKSEKTDNKNSAFKTRVTYIMKTLNDKSINELKIILNGAIKREHFEVAEAAKQKLRLRS